MDIEQKIEEVKETISTPGWRVIVDTFEKKKNGFLERLMESNLNTEKGVEDARKIQADFKAIEDFVEVVKDLISEVKEVEEE
jgi:hypothetical protein